MSSLFLAFTFFLFTFRHVFNFCHCRCIARGLWDARPQKYLSPIHAAESRLSIPSLTANSDLRESAGLILLHPHSVSGTMISAVAHT